MTISHFQDFYLIVSSALDSLLPASLIWVWDLHLPFEDFKHASVYPFPTCPAASVSTAVGPLPFVLLVSPAADVLQDAQPRTRSSASGSALPASGGVLAVTPRALRWCRSSHSHPGAFGPDLPAGASFQCTAQRGPSVQQSCCLRSPVCFCFCSAAVFITFLSSCLFWEEDHAILLRGFGGGSKGWEDHEL